MSRPGNLKPLFRASLNTGSSRNCVCRLLLMFAVIFLPAVCFSQTKRVVVVQCDGLPYDVVDEFVRERDPSTGKSQLPWFDYIFYQRGTRLENFYVRGMSLSAPSWSLLDTGQHLQIKGNVEFDRNTMQTYDYLNFLPFYVKATIGARVDMQGVEVLDSIGIPLLSDAFPRTQRYAPFSLFQRGPRFMTFGRALENRFKKEPKEFLDEWTMNGPAITQAVPAQLVREFLQSLSDPEMRYVEIVTQEFDHLAHHNNDRESQLFVLKHLDATLGQVWEAIQKSPLASETTLIVVSDHGFNTTNGVYSQGYNLVKLLASVEGGGHHVITKRRLLLDYSIKGIYPFVGVITTTSRDSYYLKSQSSDYPTAMLDFDGNERASIHWRDSDLNLLHILLQQLQRSDLPLGLRNALTKEFFATIERRRPGWQRNVDQITEELAALQRRIDRQRVLCTEQPKKFTPEELKQGRDEDAKRICAWFDIWLGQMQSYTVYAQTVKNLLGLRKETLVPASIKIADVIAPRAMGDGNSVYELQNYITGVAPGGLVLKPDGSLDMGKSFVRVDYFSLLQGVKVRNNVQAGISNRPVDMIATRIPAELVKPLITENDITSDVVWVTAGPDRQALILTREGKGRSLSFRYLPISNLKQDASGRLHFETSQWRAGLPLQLFEDPNLDVPGNREAWLTQWHTEQEWFRAVHRTRYSNGIIGLHEQLARHEVGRLNVDEPGLSADDRLLRRLLHRQRQNIEADLLVVANDHWNFDVRGFNPGGNHGSFLRISTHSTFMLWGGDKTTIPRGQVIDQPYDSLSFVPTVLALTGNLRDDNNPIPVLLEKGFRRFPGRPVKEVLGQVENRNIAVTGALPLH